MRPKKSLGRGALWIWNFKAFENFAREWKDKRELERIAISFQDEHLPGHSAPTMMVGAHETVPTLIAAALYPDRFTRSDQRGFVDFYGVLYNRAPDYVLAVLAHLRAVNRKASPIRKFLLQHGAAKDDGAIATELGPATGCCKKGEAASQRHRGGVKRETSSARVATA